jgi:hypothetical protein
MQSLPDENKSDMKFPESPSKCAKRGNKVENENPAKRAKLNLRNKRQGVEILSNRSTSGDANGSIDLAMVENETESGTVEEILVPDVGISDFLALSKDKGLSCIAIPLLNSLF